MAYIYLASYNNEENCVTTTTNETTHLYIVILVSLVSILHAIRFEINCHEKEKETEIDR